jgi:hypothetical protein
MPFDLGALRGGVIVSSLARCLYYFCSPTKAQEWLYTSHSVSLDQFRCSSHDQLTAESQGILAKNLLYASGTYLYHLHWLVHLGYVSHALHVGLSLNLVNRGCWQLLLGKWMAWLGKEGESTL